MTRPTWSTKGRFIGLRVRNVGGTRERIARSGPISTFDIHIINIPEIERYGSYQLYRKKIRMTELIYLCHPYLIIIFTKSLKMSLPFSKAQRPVTVPFYKALRSP